MCGYNLDNLYYRASFSAEVVPDAEDVDQDEKTDQTKEKPQYVEIVDPFAAEISFLKSDCPERKVIRVICDHLGEFSIY